jgi:hypothetical protein
MRCPLKLPLQQLLVLSSSILICSGKCDIHLAAPYYLIPIPQSLIRPVTMPRLSFPVISEMVAMTSLLPPYVATLGKKIDMAEQAKDPSCSFEHSFVQQ